MIERECALEAVRRDFAPREHASGIVEQDVDARLRCGDVRRGPPDLAEPKQVGIVDAVPSTRVAAAQPREHCFSALLVARYHDNARAHGSQRIGRGPADAGCGAGDDASLALHACRALQALGFNRLGGEWMRAEPSGGARDKRANRPLMCDPPDQWVPRTQASIRPARVIVPAELGRFWRVSGR